MDIRVAIAMVYLFIGGLLSLSLNKKFNPVNHMGYKYGYFLSIIAILNNILILIILGISMSNRIYYSYNPYKASYKAADVIIFIILSILISFIHISISILNAKKYKIGAILISLLTGTFIVSLFYYKYRWNELKKLPRKNYQDIKNIDYKKVLKCNSLEEYIDLFEKNRLDDIEIIMTLTENDYEKIGINILGDKKRLVNVFSKNELNKHFNEYQKDEEVKNVTTTEYRNENKKKCKHCEYIYSGCSYCPNCGSSLYEEVKSVTITKYGSNEENKNCRKCNALVPLDVYLCPKCGNESFS